MQYEEAVASNERADAMRKQAAASILAASEDEKQDVAEEQVQQIVTGAGASVSTAIDTAGVRTSLMKAAKEKGKEALKDAAKSRIKSVVEDSKLEQKAKEIKSAKGKGLISEAEELGKVGESKELADNVSRDRIIGRAFGKRAIGAMGTLANVSQGAYDLYKDTDEIEIVEITTPQEQANTLPEQTDAQVDKEQADYKKEKGQPWVQEFFHSNEYNLIDNEGGGDCLFATIRDALKSVDKDVSVMELRSKLSEQVTPEIYEQYKNHYDMFATTIVEGNAELKRLNKMNIELRDRLKNSKERNEQKQIVEQAKIVADKYKTLKNELKTSKEMLHEFRFMKKVHSVEDLNKKNGKKLRKR